MPPGLPLSPCLEPAWEGLGSCHLPSTPEVQSLRKVSCKTPACLPHLPAFLFGCAARHPCGHNLGPGRHQAPNPLLRAPPPPPPSPPHPLRLFSVPAQVCVCRLPIHWPSAGPHTRDALLCPAHGQLYWPGPPGCLERHQQLPGRPEVSLKQLSLPPVQPRFPPHSRPFTTGQGLPKGQETPGVVGSSVSRPRHVT